MPISEADFPQLLRLLSKEEHLAEVRRLVLGEQAVTARLDRIETALAALAEAQRATEARVEALAEAQRATEAKLEALAGDVKALAEAQRATEAKLEALAGDVKALVAEVRTLAQQQRRTQDRVGEMQGTLLEIKYERRAAAYFGRLIRKAKVLEVRSLEDRLEAHLSPDEVQEVFLIDLLVGGVPRVPEAGGDVVLAIEISSVVDRDDVLRAAHRASLMRRAGIRAIPVAAGEAMTEGAQAVARSSQVAVLQDGVALFWEEALAGSR